MTEHQKTQLKWFQFYKKNPDNLTPMELFEHAFNNEELDIDVKKQVIFMIDEIANPSFRQIRDLLVRQLDVYMMRYLKNENTTDAGKELLNLQIATDKVKENTWCCGNRESKLSALADVVIECYAMAHMVDGNLDDYIAKKLKAFRSQ